MSKKNIDLIHKLLSESYDEFNVDEVDSIDILESLYILVTSGYEEKYGTAPFFYDEMLQSIVKEVGISEVWSCIKDLSESLFEAFGAWITKEIIDIEEIEYYKTQDQKDQGIDFILKYKASAIISSIDYDYVIGQSKLHLSDSVKVSEIRDFAGSYLLFNHNISEYKDDLFEGFKASPFSNIKAIFVTRTFFTKQSLELCRKLGIITIDLIDIVYLLKLYFDSQGISSDKYFSFLEKELEDTDVLKRT